MMASSRQARRCVYTRRVGRVRWVVAHHEVPRREQRKEHVDQVVEHAEIRMAPERGRAAGDGAAPAHGERRDEPRALVLYIAHRPKFAGRADGGR